MATGYLHTSGIQAHRNHVSYIWLYLLLNGESANVLNDWIGLTGTDHFLKVSKEFA